MTVTQPAPGDRLTGQVVEVLRRHLRGATPARPLAPATRLEDLGLDSLSAMSLLLDLEDRFGVSFPDSMLTAGTFRTVGTLRAAIGSLTGRER
jgi:acyl carrier protein